jgi:hypothetical protein
MPDTQLLNPPGTAEPAPLPDLPAISVGADWILIEASKAFPFRTLLLTEEDGTPLSEMLSFDPTTMARLGDRNDDDRPLIRVYVDDEMIHDVPRPPSPPEVSSGGIAHTARQAETSSDAGNGDTA